MNSRLKYLFVQTGLTLVSPISSMCLALRFFRNPISWLFMVIFAYYFGSRMWLGTDATDHYVEMRLYFCGNTFEEALNNPMVFIHSPEPYTFLLKYIVSRFTSSYAVFGGVLCVIYMLLQINLLTAFRKLYKEKLTILSALLLVAVFTVVQFTWYQGVRYWPGVFFFLGFFVRYVMTKKWYHLLIACFCPLFHYTLVVLPAIVVLNHLLLKGGLRVPAILYLISFVIRAMQIDFLPFVLSHIPFIDSIYSSLAVADLDREAFVEIMDAMRDDSNAVYSIRSEVISLLLLIVLLIFKLKRYHFSDLFKLFFAMALTTASIANIEFVDITFYDRFFKFATLLLAFATFIVAVQNQKQFHGRSLPAIGVVVVMILFEVSTHIVAMRIGYLHWELWLGNFFMDWHGGLEANRMQIWGELF